jgi:hypothetical protein
MDKLNRPNVWSSNNKITDTDKYGTSFKIVISIELLFQLL